MRLKTCLFKSSMFGHNAGRSIDRSADSTIAGGDALSWSLLSRLPQLGVGGKLKWFGYNVRMITANRLARYLTEAEGRPHPMGGQAIQKEAQCEDGGQDVGPHEGKHVSLGSREDQVDHFDD